MGWKPTELLTFAVAALVGALAASTTLTLGGSLAAYRPLIAGGTGALAAAAVSATLYYRRKRLDAALQAYFVALSDVACRSSDVESAAERLPPLPTAHSLAIAVASLGETLFELCSQSQRREDLQTSLEVRSRRASAEAGRLRTIFDGLSDPVLVIDEYDELVLANRSARELLCIASSAEGKPPLGQAVHCPKLVELLTVTSRRKTSGTRTDDIELVDPEGRSTWFRATALKLAADESGSNGEPLPGAVVVLRNIDDQKALQKRNAEFVSAVSHEMKTPLAGIKAYVELLADGDANDEATREEFLQIINGQADRLQRLIDNLLNLARIEAGVVKVQKEPRSLNEILEESLRVVRPSAEAKQIELVADLSPLYLGVLADRDMLLQAAINLLSNAVKYTRSGGRVTLRSRMLDDKIQLVVEDTGVGLSEADCQRVFEKFYRVKKDKEMASGTGLGLPLAKHIVEDVHGGRIGVRSRAGEGSAFEVILPVAGELAAVVG